MLLNEAGIYLICNQVWNFELCWIVFSIQQQKVHTYYLWFFMEYKFDFEYPDEKLLSLWVWWGSVSSAKNISSIKSFVKQYQKGHFWPTKMFKQFWNLQFLSHRKRISKRTKKKQDKEKICKKSISCVNQLFLKCLILCVFISATVLKQ